MYHTDYFYITTPIYYINDIPHIGHAYCTIAADAAARFARMTGREVYFLTGTDEHGQKVEKAAVACGMGPQAYADKMAIPFQELWKRLNISNDDFIRTTQSRHIQTVQEIFNRLHGQGDIFEGEYEGWYCVHEENFWTQSQIQDGACPECGRELELVKEHNYFFAASKYSERLLEHIRNNPTFIMPETRRNEVLKLIEDGVKDVCVSRTAFRWGIPLPFNADHVAYVWFDALINYLSALGYPNGEKFVKFWPAVHLVGKDIIKFHAVIWPCMLMALGVELPSQIIAHGFWTLGEEKMSKSKGNVIDPNELIDEFGADSIRYFLLREVALGQDGEFSREGLKRRINYDLANDYGNMLHRSIPMLIKYCDGIIPEPSTPIMLEDNLRRLFAGSVPKILSAYEQLFYKEALESIWGLVSAVNKYIDEASPWAVAKEGDASRLDMIMYTLADCIRTIAAMITPVMPAAAQKTWNQLGIGADVLEQAIPQEWELCRLSVGLKVSKGEPLFPRIEEETA